MIKPTQHPIFHRISRLVAMLFASAGIAALTTLPAAAGSGTDSAAPRPTADQDSAMVVLNGDPLAT